MHEIRHIEEAHSQAAQEIEKYKCPNCPAEYRYYRNLRAHIKIHKNPDKYKCLEEGCKKVFETKGLVLCKSVHILNIKS
jgi:Zinc finger, C2H2 type